MLELSLLQHLRKQKKVQHLSDEERDFLNFLFTLDKIEFAMILNSMTVTEAREIINLVGLAKDELFDRAMEEHGMQDAEEVIKKVKQRSG